MTRQLRAIQIDPFFDGEAGQGQDAALPPREDAGAPATPPNRYGYQAADQYTTTHGLPMTAVMRPGPEGLRGTVIPRATMGGIPMGTTPHAPANLEVNIDPHIAGQSSTVRLGDINATSVRAAAQQAQGVTPEPYSIETARLRGAAVMHGIANNAQPDQAFREPPQTPPQAAPHQQPHYPQQGQQPQYDQQQPAVQPQVHQPAPAGHNVVPAPNMQQGAQAQPAPRRRISPLSAFNQAPPPPQRELRQIDLRDESPADAVGQPPTIEVTFEIQHFGTHQAYYHDIIVETGFMVLIWDTRYRGPKYFPPPAQDESAPPLALNITGTNEVYLVHTTGIQYENQGREHCVLMVERVGALPPQ